MNMKQRTKTGGFNTPAQTTNDPMKVYEDHCLKELRNAGFRITMPRVQVIRALADTDTALSAYAIHDKIISSGGKIDVVSVYRILSTLQEVGLIHHIGVVDGYFPCRIGSCADRRSEVVVEESTGSVIELSMPKTIIDALEEQARAAGYETTSIKVEITARELAAK
jgi:Fur family zinc uptake transcriptional regulator